jgi:hypothetical protein
VANAVGGSTIRLGAAHLLFRSHLYNLQAATPEHPYGRLIPSWTRHAVRLWRGYSNVVRLHARASDVMARRS